MAKKSRSEKKLSAGAYPRIPSGIQNLDKLLYGGFPDESVILVSGSPGSGKTIFSLQFIFEGALKYGQKGLYVSFEERENKVRNQALQFGWDFAAQEKKGMIRILSISKMSLGQIVSDLVSAIDECKPSRLVIDSLTYISLSAHSRNRLVELENIPVDEVLYGDEPQVFTPLDQDGIVLRKAMVDLVKMLQAKKICTIMTSEVSKNTEWHSRDTFSEFACDGVISLKATSIGSDIQRTVEVVKMRNTKTRGGIHSFDFDKNGIKINI